MMNTFHHTDHVQRSLADNNIKPLNS